MHVPYVDELKRRLVEVQPNFRQTIVDEAIDQWRKSLQACIRMKGHYFKHLLRDTSVNLECSEAS